MIIQSIDILISALLMGGIYGLIAVGLSMQYGVARVLNISHGEFIMLGAFITWTLYTIFNLNPLLSLAICGPLIFLAGFLLHKTLYRRIHVSSGGFGAAFEGNSMLASFGLLFVIQNLAIMIWGAEIRGYSFMAYPLNLGGVVFPANRMVALLFALAICAAFYLFLDRTRLGKAIRAASQDAAAAELMGVHINQVLALCFGFGALMAGLAGTLLSMSFHVDPLMGFDYTLIAIIVVVLGGLGSIPGSFVGGFILGLIGSIVTAIEPGLVLVAFYLIFMLLLLVKPAGIMGR